MGLGTEATESQPTTKTNYYVWSGGKVVYEKIGSSEARNHVYGLGEKLASAYHDQPSGWGGGMMMMMSQPPPEEPPEDPYPPQDPPDTCYTRLTYYVNDQYGSVRAGMSGSTVLTKLEYYPYGEVYSMSGGGSVYTFLGKEDPGVGLLDFGPRYYNAMLGRFLSPDPILAGASAYAYCAGNPVMLYDPSGMFQEYVRPSPRGCEDLIAQDMESEMRMCMGPGEYMVVGGDEYFIGTAREYQTMQQQKRDDELGRPGSGMKSVKVDGTWVWLTEEQAEAYAALKAGTNVNYPLDGIRVIAHVFDGDKSTEGHVSLEFVNASSGETLLYMSYGPEGDASWGPFNALPDEGVYRNYSSASDELNAIRVSDPSAYYRTIDVTGGLESPLAALESAFVEMSTPSTFGLMPGGVDTRGNFPTYFNHCGSTSMRVLNAGGWSGPAYGQYDAPRGWFPQQMTRHYR